MRNMLLPNLLLVRIHIFTNVIVLYGIKNYYISLNLILFASYRISVQVVHCRGFYGILFTITGEMAECNRDSDCGEDERCIFTGELGMPHCINGRYSYTYVRNTIHMYMYTHVC